MKQFQSRLGRPFVVVVAVVCLRLLAAGQADDTQAIKTLIATYATSINLADAKLADQLFADGSEVTFIHPRGELRGRDRIKSNFYLQTMGQTFSERKLTPRDISVSVYGDTAWAEFHWEFAAKVRKDGRTLRSQGRETQVYHRERGQWRIVHVHYSGAPVTGNLRGF